MSHPHPVAGVRDPATRIAALLGGSLLVAGCGGGGGAVAIPPPDPSSPPAIELATPIALSTGLAAVADAQRGRLVRLTRRVGTEPNPRLLAVFEHGIGPEVADFDGVRHPARDMFLTLSLDDGLTWSTPTNLSGSAGLWSRTADHDGDPATPPEPYYGTTGRSVVMAQEARVVVAWVSTYATGGVQGSAVYPDAGNIEVPHACVQSTFSLDGGTTWSPVQQITDARRDASNLMMHSSSSGFALVWQEDPRGLQPGEGEGPGDGGSGARVSPGTDVWAATMSVDRMLSGLGFTAASRVTDNFLGPGPDGLDSGDVGACRPQVRVIGPSLVVAYEETKQSTGPTAVHAAMPTTGEEGGEAGGGKVIRYHVRTRWGDPTSDPTLKAGWVVSDPAENGRRVRILSQGTPGSATGLRMTLLWRQGVGNQGAAADILSRMGLMVTTDPASTGLRPQDLVPAVVPEATALDQAARNHPALNLSSSMGLTAATSADPDEDARAHRGFLRGDCLLLGWNYTANAILAEDSDLFTYDFLFRRSLDGGTTWEAARSLSGLQGPAGNPIEAVEPRLVQTPLSAEPDETLAPDALFGAWVTALREGGVWLPQDIYLTWSRDLGVRFQSRHLLAGGPAAQSEPQMVCSPDGRILHAVWIESVEPAGSVVKYRRGRILLP